MEPLRVPRSLVVPPLAAARASAQGRDLTFPRQDRSVPPSVAVGVGPGSKEPSGPEGLCIGFMVVELFTFLYTYFHYVYIYVCACRRPYICRHLSEPLRSSSSMCCWYRRASWSPCGSLAAAWCIPCLPVRRGATGPILGRIGLYHLRLPSELGLGGRNRAAPKVCA